MCGFGVTAAAITAFGIQDELPIFLSKGGI
jgi:hypothetical protein